MSYFRNSNIYYIRSAANGLVDDKENIKGFFYDHGLKTLMNSDRNLDINQKGGWNNSTALMLAVQKKQTNVIDFLLNNKVRIDEQNIAGNSALMIAAIYGNFEQLKQLMEHEYLRPDIDIKNKYDQSAVMLAVEKGHVEIAKYLADKVIPPRIY